MIFIWIDGLIVAIADFVSIKFTRVRFWWASEWSLTHRSVDSSTGLAGTARQVWLRQLSSENCHRSIVSRRRPSLIRLKSECRLIIKSCHLQSFGWETEKRKILSLVLKFRWVSCSALTLQWWLQCWRWIGGWMPTIQLFVGMIFKHFQVNLNVRQVFVRHKNWVNNGNLINFPVASFFLVCFFSCLLLTMSQWNLGISTQIS